MQLRPAEFLGREHDPAVVLIQCILGIRATLPSAPRNMLGPSTLVAWVENNAFEGVTVRSATRSCSITTGARNANSVKSTAVNASKGARYKVADLDKAEIMIRTAVREERGAGVVHDGW